MSLQAPSLLIYKVVATGNDFLLTDLTQSENLKALKTHWAAFTRAELIKQWCDRHNGLGADGGFFIEPDAACDFSWDFYNSDGSPAELCGNAARAACLYMSKRLNKDRLSLRTRAGEVTGHVKSADAIEVALPPIQDSQWNQSGGAGTTALSYDFIRAGVPHVIVKVPRLDQEDKLTDLASRLRSESRFAVEGTNVTFVCVQGPLKIKSQTYERGAGLTLSCGTGAVAAAHSLLRGEEEKTVEVEVPGGHLSVIWKNGRPHLCGPAKVVAEMRPLSL